MIELTKYAALKVQEIAEGEGVPAMIRAQVRGGGCAGFTNELDFEKQVNDIDETFLSHGVTIVVDSISLQYLDGSTIDYEEKVLGTSGFKFINPNSTGSCGCGSSFSV